MNIDSNLINNILNVINWKIENIICEIKKLSTIQEIITEKTTVGKISGAPANNQSLNLPFSKIIFLATLLKKTASELKKKNQILGLFLNHVGEIL